MFVAVEWYTSSFLLIHLDGCGVIDVLSYYSKCSMGVKVIIDLGGYIIIIHDSNSDSNLVMS